MIFSASDNFLKKNNSLICLKINVGASIILGVKHYFREIIVNFKLASTPQYVIITEEPGADILCGCHI